MQADGSTVKKVNRTLVGTEKNTTSLSPLYVHRRSANATTRICFKKILKKLFIEMIHSLNNIKNIFQLTPLKVARV